MAAVVARVRLPVLRVVLVKAPRADHFTTSLPLY